MPAPYVEAKVDHEDPTREFLSKLATALVWCVHRKEGCEWSGQKHHIDTHLSVSPSSANPMAGCQYVSITCTNCSTKMLRWMYMKHELIDCKHSALNRTLYQHQREMSEQITSIENDVKLLRQQLSQYEPYLKRGKAKR